MSKTTAPKLRFPEFLESGEWKSESLGDVYSFQSTNSFSRDQLNYESGSVKNIHYGDIHTKFATLFDITKENVPFINSLEPLNKISLESYCVEGDIVFADASEDMEDVGKSIELVYLNNEKLLAGMHTLLARQKEKRIVVGFGGYLFKSNRIRTQIKKEAQGAKVYGISANRLLNIDICFPADKKEQQKIADCLTSLDELIAAERAQLEALKTYKKGLLQNLFPAEGETVPALRFPEFQSAGEWEETQLGNISSISSGGTPSKDIPEYWNGTIPWISASSMYDTNIANSELKITEFAVKNGAQIAKKGSLLILVRGSMLFNRVPMGIASIDVAFNQDVKALTIADGINVNFLLYQLFAFESRIPINETGIGAGKIETDTLKQLAIYIPIPSEQQKIAELLTSIDEEIAGQSQRVAVLQVHKQGLLQGLFPRGGVGAG